MTTTIEITQGKQDLTTLLNLAKAGNEVVFTEGTVPIARLVGLPAPPTNPPRRAGLHQGAITVTDDFADPLPDEFWTGTP